jgi:hypothetical protein
MCTLIFVRPNTSYIYIYIFTTHILNIDLKFFNFRYLNELYKILMIIKFLFLIYFFLNFSNAFDS